MYKRDGIEKWSSFGNAYSTDNTEPFEMSCAALIVCDYALLNAIWVQH